MKTTLKLLTQSNLDSTDILRADHMKVEALLLQLRFFKSAGVRTRTLKTIQQELHKHMRIEEEIFYPVAHRVEEAAELVDHAYEEHEEIRHILSRLSEMNPATHTFSKTVNHLIRTIEDHIMHEEDQIFPIVRSRLDELSLKRLDRDVLQAYEAEKAMRRRARVQSRGAQRPSKPRKTRASKRRPSSGRSSRRQVA